MSALGELLFYIITQQQEENQTDTKKKSMWYVPNGTTTTIDLSVALASNMVNAVLVFKNGLNILNMTALGDTAADSDEFNVSATGGGSGVGRLTFGSALENGTSLLVWYIQ